MANEILTRIKEEFSRLEEMNNPYDLDRSTTDILGLLTQLSLDQEYEELALKAILDITATLQLEVVESIDSYKEAREKSSLEIKKKEYDQIIKKAATQVRWDLMPVIYAE